MLLMERTTVWSLSIFQAASLKQSSTMLMAAFLVLTTSQESLLYFSTTLLPAQRSRIPIFRVFFQQILASSALAT
jgi:hypothetical protein